MSKRHDSPPPPLSAPTAAPRVTRLWRASAALLPLLLACPGTQSPAEGCAKDTDCKGNRVCDSGRCVWPPEEGEPPEEEGAAPVASGPRWYRGGPGHAGPSSVVGPSQRPKLAWEHDLGAVVFATPTIAAPTDAAPTAFVGTHAGRFVGVGVGDGKLSVDMNLGGRVWATAAANDEGLLFVGADDDHLYAIDAAKAEVAWKLKLGSCEPTRAPGPEGARCDVDGGPTIGPNGDLYVGADGVYRVSQEGDIKWHYPEGEERPKHVFSTPVVAADGSVYFGGQDGFVTALDANGKERWRYKINSDVDGSPALGPDGELFVGADDGRVHAIRSDGSLRWSFVAQKDIRSAIGIGPGARLYTTSFDGSLYALEASGEVVWVYPTGAPIQSSPVVDASGVVFFGGQDDRLYAVNAEGKLVWRIDMPKDVDSSVALAEDGTLVVGCDDGFLRAYR